MLFIEKQEKQEALSKLKERLLDIEAEQLSGANYYTLEELDSTLRKITER